MKTIKTTFGKLSVDDVFVWDESKASDEKYRIRKMNTEDETFSSLGGVYHSFDEDEFDKFNAEGKYTYTFVCDDEIVFKVED